ncbi:MAG TPA: GAF domain-containing protein [Casimicrobiaceae bacterium]|nr:GAF domain-containing protein [Casimicrobiaceae bacterium]
MGVTRDTSRLRRLQSLTDAALAHLDLEPLLGALLERTRDMLEADTCAVLLLDEATDELVARAAVGIEAGVRIPIDRGFAGRVAATRAPVVIEDVNSSDVLNPLLHEKGITSMVGVPLMVAGHAIGVLHVGTVQQRTFGSEDVELLQLAADRAAIAIEHARLFEAEQHARRRIERIQAVTDAALAHLDVRDLLDVLLPRLQAVLSADMCTVFLADKKGLLVARASVGIDNTTTPLRVPVGTGFPGVVAAERKPLILHDLNETDVLNPMLRLRGIRSMLGVPLLVRGDVIGVINVGSSQEHAFTGEDVDLLQLAADRAALAIEHARVFETERAMRERMERVQAVTDAALAHLDLEQLLAVMVPRIRDIVSADTCAVLLLDESTDELVARAAVGIEEEVEAGIRVPLGRGFAGRVASERQPMILHDVDTADIWNPILRQKGIKSMLGVPLLVSGDAIGVLHVGSLKERTFQADDIELLQFVAERVAIAIERAQLHEQTVLLDQLKLNFVAVASHELRTPATAVYGALATMRERRLEGELREELLDMAFEQSDRLRRLLEQLLDLSRLDARAIKVDPRPLVLQNVLGKIAEETLPEGVDVKLEVDGDVAVVADPLVLDRIVSNLLINAWRYGAPPIVVHAEQKDRHLRIGVEDAGPGIPAELRGHLFDRFTRGEQAAGSGLGLAIALAYARAHGGDLVHEERDGGSSFVLVVPVN